MKSCMDKQEMQQNSFKVKIKYQFPKAQRDYWNRISSKLTKCWWMSSHEYQRYQISHSRGLTSYSGIHPSLRNNNKPQNEKKKRIRRGSSWRWIARLLALLRWTRLQLIQFLSPSFCPAPDAIARLYWMLLARACKGHKFPRGKYALQSRRINSWGRIGANSRQRERDLVEFGLVHARGYWIKLN